MQAEKPPKWAASTALWTSVVGCSTLDFGNNDHYGLVTTSDGDYDTTGLYADRHGRHSKSPFRPPVSAGGLRISDAYASKLRFRVPVCLGKFLCTAL